jgi:hypothetical protein
MGPKRLTSRASRPVKPDTSSWKTRRPAHLGGRPTVRPNDWEHLPTPRGALLQHVVAFGGALLVVAVVTKALRVAHMDLTTAQVLLVNGNVASVVSGVLLLFFPALIIFGLFICAGVLLTDLVIRTLQSLARSRDVDPPDLGLRHFPLKRRTPLVACSTPPPGLLTAEFSRDNCILHDRSCWRVPDGTDSTKACG